jgi:hypothetical protein
MGKGKGSSGGMKPGSLPGSGGGKGSGGYKVGGYSSGGTSSGYGSAARNSTSTSGAYGKSLSLSQGVGNKPYSGLTNLLGNNPISSGTYRMGNVDFPQIRQTSKNYIEDEDQRRQYQRRVQQKLLQDTKLNYNQNYTLFSNTIISGRQPIKYK